MQHRRIIKQGPVVVATTETGSIDPSSTSSQGLFLADTRYLSRFQIRLNGMEPVLLGSSEEEPFQSSFLHTNPPLGDIPARALGVLQRITIHGGRVQIEVTLVNWSLKVQEVELSIEIDCDFFDSFEARGVKRLKRGEIKKPAVTRHSVELEYLGLDNVTRITQITLSPRMARFENKNMYFPLKLEPAERLPVTLDLSLVEEAPEGTHVAPRPDVSQVTKPPWFDECAEISVSNADVQAVLQRGTEDLEILMTEYRDLWVPAAGLPRFSVPFGRDSIITGLMTLVWNHQLSKDVLRFIAKTQGKEENPWNYEQPGKIIHEMHTGELARLGEIPFGQFYGSVDSTPLFLVLGAEHLRWTGDMDLYRELKPNYDAAWKWIDDFGNIDGSGYIQYKAHTPPKASSAALTVGLFNQGWKDSSTAVMYSDGTMCTDHPVALSEVQGALYRALSLWGDLYLTMPESERMTEEGHKLKARAAKLKEQFNREFWMPDKQFYAMALDGHHRQVDSITSNPGHCLWSRLIDDDKAPAVVRKLLDEPMFSAWGIRTMANTEKAYNPFSYHDGSVWPFENALIASGIKKYWLAAEVQQVFDAMIAASRYFEYRRWPEVYCGVSKSIGGVLARQPDASRPQAWSSAAIFLLLQTLLGVASVPFSKRIDVTAALPTCLDEIVVRNLSIAGAKLSLRLIRQGEAVLMEVMDNPNDLDIVIHPATRHMQAAMVAGAPR